MKLFCRIVIAVGAYLLLGPAAFSQMPGSQNDTRDIVNSVIPGKPHLGKEKTEQVDPSKLPSKSTKDPAFQGSLLDVGLGSNGDIKSHEKTSGDADKNSSKPADASGNSESKTSKQTGATTDKDTNVSKSSGAGAGVQTKKQKTTSARSDKKEPETSSEKTSSPKPDGDH